MGQQEIDFVGGPMDGLTYPLSHSPDRLPAEIKLPVNPSLLKFMFMGEERGQICGPTTSIAVYQQEEEGVPRYCHRLSVAEEEHERDDLEHSAAPGLQGEAEDALRRESSAFSLWGSPHNHRSQALEAAVSARSLRACGRHQNVPMLSSMRRTDWIANFITLGLVVLLILLLGLLIL